MHSYSRSDLLSNSLTMPQRTTSPVHGGGPTHLPAISDTMGSMYTDTPGQAQSTAESKGIDAASMRLIQPYSFKPSWPDFGDASIPCDGSIECFLYILYSMHGEKLTGDPVVVASGNNSNKSSSDTKPEGVIDSTSSRPLDVPQAGGTWPKKGPEVCEPPAGTGFLQLLVIVLTGACIQVVFFHCTPLRGQAAQIPRAVCDNMFAQCGTVVNITMHPTEIR